MPQFIFFLILGILIRFNFGIFTDVARTAPEFTIIARPDLWYQNFLVLPQNLINLFTWYSSRVALWIAGLSSSELLNHLLYQISETGITAMIYILSRKVFRATPAAAFYAAAVYIINPANWLIRNVFSYQPGLAIFALLFAVRLAPKKSNVISVLGLAIFTALLLSGSDIRNHFYLVLPFMTIAAAAASQLWPVYLLASAGPFIPFPRSYYLIIFMLVPAIAWAAVIYDQTRKK